VKILIVSPHFPPINAADHQRVRMSLPYYQQFGCEPHILTVHPDQVEGTYDPLLLETIPKNIPVTQVRALPTKLTRRFGFGTLGWRCLPYLASAGNRLLSTQSFDLIYFSTTAFPVMSLATQWYKRFGVPYVLDFQDPWLSDYYSQSSALPPGGRLKYALNQFFAKKQEPKVMRHVSHVISVSPAYPKILKQRYAWLTDKQFTVLPFGAPETDFELLPSLNIQQSIFNPHDGNQHWVYVGRGGNDMALALQSLFLAIKQEREHNPEPWNTIKLHFVGTSYATAERAVKTIEPIAQKLGVGDLVEEHVNRVPYFEALKILIDSDAILMIGSDDPSYTASKLYPCILAKKPILAIFHEQSSVVQILQKSQSGYAVTFRSNDKSENLTADIVTHLNWLLTLPKGYQPSTNWASFQAYTAKELARQQCIVFNQCLTASMTDHH
jgi:hypothetical protein